MLFINTVTVNKMYNRNIRITKFYYSVVKDFDRVFLFNNSLHHKIHVVSLTGILNELYCVFIVCLSYNIISQTCTHMEPTY